MRSATIFLLIAFPCALAAQQATTPADLCKSPGNARATDQKKPKIDKNSNAVSVSDVIQPETFPVPAADAVNYLACWSNWNEPEIHPLLPLAPVKSWGKLQEDLPPNPSDSDIFVIHIVNSSDVPKSGTHIKDGAKVDIKDSNWFFYRYNSDKTFHKLLKPDNSAPVSSNGIAAGTLPPLYGIKNGYLISVSVLELWPERNNQDPKTWPAPPALTYTITPTLGTPGNVTALKALVGAVLNASQTGTASTGKLGVLPVTYKYQIAVSISKISAKDLKAPFSVAFTAVPSTTVTNTDPSDCHNVTAKTTCSLTQSFSVLDVEHWNVGINVVAYGPVEHKYALNSSNVVTMTKTRHMPLYAVFDYSPWAKKYPMTSWPYFQGGLPLNGSPLHLPYAGMAWGLPFTKKFLPLSVYAGVGFMKQTKLNNLPVGSTSNVTAFTAAQEVDWAKKPLFGVEVPISSIVGKIKSSVGSGK
jgi:hypothetical protein